MNCNQTYFNVISNKQSAINVSETIIHRRTLINVGTTVNTGFGLDLGHEICGLYYITELQMDRYHRLIWTLTWSDYSDNSAAMLFVINVNY